MARMLLWYTLGVVLLVSAYYTAPAARPVLVGVVGLVSIAAIEYGVRRLGPERVGAWRLVAVSAAFLTIGDIVFTTLDTGSVMRPTFPDVPDIFYVASHLSLTIALLWLGAPRVPYHHETSLIDVISVTLAGSLLIWILVVRPEFQEQRLNTLGRIAAVASWVSYLAVATASARIMIYWRRCVSVALLSLAVLSLLAWELFYGKELVRGTWTVGRPVDLGYFVFIALVGAAALHPSMRDLASPARARHKLGPWQLTMIAIALLVGPTALLVEASIGGVQTSFAIAIISGLVSVLMLTRLIMTGRALQRRAAREHAVRVASQAMVSAITPMDVIAGIRAALRAVAREHGMIDVELAGPDAPEAVGRHGAQAPLRPDVTVSVGPGSRGELAIPLRGPAASLIFAAPVSELVELTDLLHSLTDQTALALHRIQLAQVARAEERERYFRTLVLTSTEVILISRDGRIEYATPSAQNIFGRCVVGERFDDIVHPARPGPPGSPGRGRCGQIR